MALITRPGAADIPAPRPGAVVPLENLDLRTVYDRYRAVCGRRLAPDLIETPEMASARAALIHALLADGWEAPDLVQIRLMLDEEVLDPRFAAAS